VSSEDRRNGIIGSCGLGENANSTTSVFGGPVDGEKSWAVSNLSDLRSCRNCKSARINGIDRSWVEGRRTLEGSKVLWRISNENRICFINGDCLSGCSLISRTVSSSESTNYLRRTERLRGHNVIRRLDVYWSTTVISSVSFSSAGKVQAARNDLVSRSSNNRINGVDDGNPLRNVCAYITLVA